MLGRKYLTNGDDFQNIFIYQSTNSQLTIEKTLLCIEYVSAWLSKGSKYNSKLFLGYGVHAAVVEHYDYKLKVLFNGRAFAI